MKKFFEEFKKFITRGNVLDMAVGVIVGGAFTAIVNGMSNFILKPVINWLLALILGSNSLDGILTYLKVAYTTDANGAQVIDLANSIYINWGEFINAVINFFLIAFVLFSIVKIINRVKDGNGEFSKKIKERKISKEERKELKSAGIKLTDWESIKAFRLEKKAEADKKAEEEKKIAEEKAIADRLANPTTEDLLKQIKELLEKQAK